MDIKESLGKIEQYWQIIRNLHFHIEQEGKISPEEYALIDKYLKVISQKYAALVTDEQEDKEQVIAQIVHTVQEVKNHEPLPVTPTAALQEPYIEVAPPAQSKNEEQKVITTEVKSVLSEVLPEDMQTKPAENNSLSSMLQKMLEEPSSIPATPLTVDKTVKKSPTFNERMMESRTGKEDLNSRIKKTMAETISLNEKFEFIRELFGNNPVDYATALSYIDARSESNQAWMKVEMEFAEKYNWSTKPGSVEKLKKVVERRYQ
jgi:hypothetical protein